ncbi:hypothetical protein [Halocola ammonii]
MNRKLYTLLAAIFCGTLFSCEVINPTEEEPAYIHIETFEFETSAGEGSDSQNITELWVYANGKNVGVYDLPADIPILEQGDTEIQIGAGIKNNGSSETRIIYPFYTVHEEIVNLQPFETDTLIPQFSYIEGLDFFHEDFEDPGIKFDPDEFSDTSMTIVNDEELVFEGNGTGKITLTEDKQYYYGKTDENLALPFNQVVMAELNYRSNNSFVVGLIAEGPGGIDKQFALQVNPRDDGPSEWTKLYIDLGYVVTLYPNAQSFELYIESGLDGDNETGQVYFDNIKILHR